MKLLLPKFAGLALLVLLAGVVNAQAAEDKFLAQLVGDWVGNGTMRAAADAAPERILCRVTNRLVDDGRALEQSGRCGVASNTGTFSGKITARGANRYEGRLDSLAADGPITLEGRSRGGALVFRTEFTDIRTGDPAVATTVMSILPSGGYRLTSRRDDPGGTEYGESDIVFTAR
ncbi:MAG: hypothetical protein ACTSU0_03125 [Alphaproteobacteria bacterium]